MANYNKYTWVKWVILGLVAVGFILAFTFSGVINLTG